MPLTSHIPKGRAVTVKYIGMAVIFFSLVYGGRYAAYTYKQRQKELCGFLTLTGCISSQIEFYNAKLCDIYSSCEITELPGFVNELRKGTSFEIALESVPLHIDKSDRILLGEFASTLGRVSRDEQLRSCKYTAEQLKSRCDRCSAELPKKVKLAENLSLLAGLMVVLLLL